ncbi:MAG: signal transduction histidine kinase [Lysobacterales bacterium]|jgi:signal transduction histidine kinase
MNLKKNCIKTNFNNSLNLLVVEDNPVDSKVVKSMIESVGKEANQMTLVDSLAAAIDQLNQNKYDCLLLDLNLSDSKGTNTINVITKKFPLLPIVVNTGAYEDEIGIEILGLGAQDFLVKGMYTEYALNKVIKYAVERKRLEIELKEAYEDLKAMQGQLIESEKMKVVGGLASGVAHEVKNPLATILYGATYLAENVTSDDKNYQTVVDNIQDATYRANYIIKDLLDFSHIGKISIEKNNINEVIDRAVKLVSFQLRKDAINIQKKLDEKLPLVNIDRNKMGQVVVNLILNAAHAIGNKGNIDIQTFRSSLKDVDGLVIPVDMVDKDVVVIKVTDDGCGVEEDSLNDLFNPFYTTRRAKGGIGLGLSVVKNIIDMHEGLISIVNNKGKGASVILIIVI